MPYGGDGQPATMPYGGDQPATMPYGNNQPATMPYCGDGQPMAITRKRRDFAIILTFAA